MVKVSNIQAAPYKRDPRRVWWDEKDCERLTRSEYYGLMQIMIVLNYAAHGQDDLRERLKSIPSGNQRMAMALGGLRAICDDIVGTIPVGQAKQIRNTMQDRDVQIVPKLTARSRNVIFEESVAKALMDAAMEKCRGCVEDGESCRKCKLYKVMEAAMPLDHYGDTVLCPYALAEWED